MKILASNSVIFSKKIFAGDDITFLISFLEESEEILQESTVSLLSVIAASEESLAMKIISNNTIPVKAKTP
jgi:hypothetical protein